MDILRTKKRSTNVIILDLDKKQSLVVKYLLSSCAILTLCIKKWKTNASLAFSFDFGCLYDPKVKLKGFRDFKF